LDQKSRGDKRVALTMSIMGGFRGLMDLTGAVV
jgi:hypothetical protein